MKTKHRFSTQFFLLIILFFSFNASAKETKIPFKKWWIPQGIEIFKKAYPDIQFIPTYDKEAEDWLVTIIVCDAKNPQKKHQEDLYWCDSKFLPKDKLDQKDNYRPLLYNYSFTVPDPNTFTEQDIQLIKEFTDRDNRKNSPIDPPFFYDLVYDCTNRESTERHIVSIPFLTLNINVHERIKEPLERVSKKIMALPRDEEMTKFLSTLTRTDGYAWRTVRDTQSRSFHSRGLAIDILPKNYYQRIIYWSWQKQLRPDDWYMTEISKRWAPPKKVIEIFKEEGFIWGGTWIVWDNMHFEYHPELLVD